MTTGAAFLGGVISDLAKNPDAPSLIRGTVVQIGAAIRVDSNGMKLLCDTLEPAIQVGNTVWVLRSGAEALILGIQNGPTPNKINDFAIRGAAIFATSGGANTLGNGVLTSTYMIDRNHMVDWWGSFQLGSTTSWPTGNLLLIPPVAYDTTSFVTAAASQTGAAVRAYNGTFHDGFVEYGGGGANTLTLIDAAVAGVVWSTTSPFTWGAGHILNWNLRYPAAA